MKTKKKQLIKAGILGIIIPILLTGLTACSSTKSITDSFVKSSVTFTVKNTTSQSITAKLGTVDFGTIESGQSKNQTISTKGEYPVIINGTEGHKNSKMTLSVPSLYENFTITVSDSGLDYTSK